SAISWSSAPGPPRVSPASCRREGNTKRLAWPPSSGSLTVRGCAPGRDKRRPSPPCQQDFAQPARFRRLPMTFAQALLLGAVQGLTELVPVSSTAPLYLTQALLGIRNDELVLSFDVVLHLGTVLALVLATWRQLEGIVSELFRFLAGRPARDP